MGGAIFSLTAEIFSPTTSMATRPPFSIEFVQCCQSDSVDA